MAEEFATVALAENVSQTAQASYEEYLALPHEGRLIEWVNGEAIFHMPPTLAHQEIVGYLTTLFTLFTNFLGLGRVLPAPAEMRCGRDGPSREPDIMFVAKSNLSRIADEKRGDGPADLVIEVVSDDSVARDFDEKFVEYQECGVREYWIIDPRDRRKRALFYQIGADGLFASAALEEGGVYRAKAVPGFWLKVEWLWELPDPQLTFAEIAGFSEQTMAELQARKQNSA